MTPRVAIVAAWSLSQTTLGLLRTVCSFSSCKTPDSAEEPHSYHPAAYPLTESFALVPIPLPVPLELVRFLDLMAERQRLQIKMLQREMRAQAHFSSEQMRILLHRIDELATRVQRLENRKQVKSEQTH